MQFTREDFRHTGAGYKCRYTTMTTVEDSLDDDEAEAIEQAILDAKREKTPYGSLVASDDE